MIGACALYLHCVALVKDMLQRIGSIEIDASVNIPAQCSENSTQNQNQNLCQNQLVLERLKEVSIETLLWS